MSRGNSAAAWNQAPRFSTPPSEKFRHNATSAAVFADGSAQSTFSFGLARSIWLQLSAGGRFQTVTRPRNSSWEESCRETGTKNKTRARLQNPSFLPFLAISKPSGLQKGLKNNHQNDQFLDLNSCVMRRPTMHGGITTWNLDHEAAAAAAAVTVCCCTHAHWAIKWRRDEMVPSLTNMHQVFVFHSFLLTRLACFSKGAFATD